MTPGSNEPGVFVFKEREMANIDKQLVAKMPAKEFNEFTLDFRNDWCVPIKKIWNKREIDRFTFRLSNDEGVFECGPKLAEELSKTVGDVLHEDNIDIEKVNDIRVVILKENNEDGFRIGVYTEELPKRAAALRLWESIKKCFSRKEE